MIEEERAKKLIELFMAGMSQCRSEEQEMEYIFDWLLVPYLYLQRNYGEKKAIRVMQGIIDMGAENKVVALSTKNNEVH